MCSFSLGNYLHYLPPLSSGNARTSKTRMDPKSNFEIPALYSYLRFDRRPFPESGPPRNILTVVIFQGYDVFSRGNAFWAIASKPWSATLAPWVTFGIFLILLAIGIWISGLKGPHLSQEMLFSGAASRSPDKTKPERWIYRKVNHVLDNI
jgi:hypothetical protein